MRRQLRAWVMLLVISVHLLYAIPKPAVSDEQLAEPTWQQRRAAQWSEVLSGIGVAVDPPSVQDAFRISARWTRDTVETLQAPVAWMFRATKTTQRWGLFGAVTETPDRLVIEVLKDGEWSPRYIRLHPEHDWRAGLFAFRRVRGIWDSVRDEPKGTYLRLAKYAAQELMREDPDVRAVRFLLERQRLTLPWEPVSDELTRRAVQRHRRTADLDDEVP